MRNPKKAAETGNPGAAAAGLAVVANYVGSGLEADDPRARIRGFQRLQQPKSPKLKELAARRCPNNCGYWDSKKRENLPIDFNDLQVGGEYQFLGHLF